MKRENTPSDEIEMSWKKYEFAKQDKLLTLARYKDKSPVENGLHIPLFAAVKNLLDSSTHSITK